MDAKKGANFARNTAIIWMGVKGMWEDQYQNEFGYLRPYALEIPNTKLACPSMRV